MFGVPSMVCDDAGCRGGGFWGEEGREEGEGKAKDCGCVEAEGGGWV